VAKLLELRRVRFGGGPVVVAAAGADAGAGEVRSIDAGAGDAMPAPAVVAASSADASVVLEPAPACTPSCLPACTVDQLASPAMEDVRGRVEQHLAAQELEVEWPPGGVPAVRGAVTMRDCAAFELLMFTLSRHLSCQVPIARCAGVEK
jgi:hypothetical protein